MKAPTCTEPGPHAAHPGIRLGDVACAGLSQDEAQVTALFDDLSGYLRKHFPPSRRPPDGLQLQVHPLTRLRVLKDERSPQIVDFHLTTLLGVPVKVDPELPEDSWRLVIVTEDVLLASADREAARGA